MPFQIAVLWLINGGDPNYLLSGMILQVEPGFGREPLSINGSYLHVLNDGSDRINGDGINGLFHPLINIG